MAEFLGSTLKAHVDAFDHLVEQTDSALSHPAVIEELGELATTLRQANSELIFPNIVDGRIEVPTSKIETNGAVLLPLLTGDQTATRTTGLGSTILRPTPRREAWLTQKMAENDPALNAASRIDREHRRVIDSLSDFRLSDRKVHQGLTIGIAHNIPLAIPLLYATRRLILASNTTVESDVASTGLVIGHELSHVNDHETAELKATLKETAENELRAYHIGHTIFKAHYPLADESMEQFRKTSLFEQLRLAHTDPSQPFEATPDLIKELQDAGIFN